jgi:actin-like ATPase involved in cell morphogenesis
MTYYLGIDLGTTYTAAAAERSGVVEAQTLGNRSASVPSVVFLRDDGEILVGEAATRRATTDPGRVAREFKRRLGDPTPIILGGTPYAAEMLMARLLRWSVDRVQEHQGEPPRAIALTHPANWGPYKLDLLAQAVRQVDLQVALMLAEPVAAATFYASQRTLEPGSVVAVYDLGGGTFDAAVVRRTAVGFDIVGSPEGIERLGGIDFDEAVFAHVQGAVGDDLGGLDPEQPSSQAAVARLRQECIDAKEALSSDTDVSIPVLLPGIQTEVRLTRAEFETMIRPAIGETIVALRRAIRSAGVAAEEITTVLLVGGSSRIPLVAQMVGAELGRPISIDAHPKDAIAYGAAIALAGHRGTATPESVTTVHADRRPPPPTMAAGASRPRGVLTPPPRATRPAPPRAAPAAAAGAAALADRRPPPPTQRAPRPAPPRPRPDRPAPPTTAPPPRDERPAPPTGPPPTPQAPASAAPRAAPPSSPPPTPALRPAPATAPPPRDERPAPPPTPKAPAPAAERPPAPAPPTSPPPVRKDPAAAAPRPALPASRPPSRTAPVDSPPFPAAASGLGVASGERPAVSGRGVPPLVERPGGAGASGSAERPAVGDDGGRRGRRVLLGAVGAGVVVAVVLAAALALGGGGGGEPRPRRTTTTEGYSDELEESFLTRCDSGGASRSVCQCTYDKFEATVPFKRFVEIDEEIQRNPDAQPRELTEILDECVNTTTIS